MNSTYQQENFLGIIMKNDEKQIAKDDFKLIKEIQKNNEQTINQLYQQLQQEEQKSKQNQEKNRIRMAQLRGKSQTDLYTTDAEQLKMPVDGDISLGSRIYTIKCSSCHSLEALTSTKRESAPSIGMIYNRKAGSDPNYPFYSQHMLDSNFHWTSYNLYRFLADPRQLLPFTNCKLFTNPLSSSVDRADLVEFLQQFSRQLSFNIKVKLIKAYGYDQYQTKMHTQSSKSTNQTENLIQ